jgi:hypothetical protein
MRALRSTSVATLLGVAALALSACVDGGLVKPGASEAEVERDRSDCRALSLGPARRPDPPTPPTFSSSGAPTSIYSSNNAIGDDQMNEVLDRMSIDPTAYAACLRSRGFQDP